MSNDDHEAVREYSEPVLTRNRDGRVTVEWEGRRGYKHQTVFSDGKV